MGEKERPRVGRQVRFFLSKEVAKRPEVGIGKILVHLALRNLKRVIAFQGDQPLDILGLLN
jgi:hypothetical protein